MSSFESQAEQEHPKASATKLLGAVRRWRGTRSLPRKQWLHCAPCRPKHGPGSEDAHDHKVVTVVLVLSQGLTGCWKPPVSLVGSTCAHGRVSLRARDGPARCTIRPRRCPEQLLLALWPQAKPQGPNAHSWVGGPLQS